jgi:hypothetical protein
MKRTYPFNLNVLTRLCAVLLFGLISACSAASTAPSTGPETAESASPTPALFTADPRPFVTSAGTPAALATPITTPGPSWTTFSASGIQFAAPSDWSEQAAGVLEGPDGFAHLSVLPIDGAAPGAACLTEANRAKPGRFGQLPEIRDLYQNAVQTGCLILPSPDQPAGRRGESLLLLWLPSSRQAAVRLALHADRTHIEAIAASLHLAEIIPIPPSGCDYSIRSQAPRTFDADRLRITEFAVASEPAGAACDPLADPPAFNALASSGEAAARTASVLDAQFSSQRMERLNQRLAPFGISVRTSERRFTITLNGNKLHANISWIGPLSMNSSVSDFRLPMVDGYDGGTFILSPAGLQRPDDWDILLYDRVFPVFAGDDLISLAYDYEVYPRQVNNPALLNIFKNGEVIDTWSVSGASLDGGPARSLSAWQGHWLLELPGVVLEDGQSLNERLGYSEMFTWRIINQRPFYFFRQDVQVRISYNDQVLEPVYDQVLYEPLGGTAILLRLKAYESGLFFYARRANTWYYVVIESIA